MRKGQDKRLSAVTMRNTLAFLLIVITIGAVVGFYFGLQMVKAYSIEVSHAVADSDASGKTIGQLSALKQQLADGQVLVAKADKLFSTPQTFQTQALKDFSKYADQSGVVISNIESNASADAATINGYSEIVTLQSPVSYAKFLKFIDAIEGNLPKMQITGISVGRPKSISGDMITTDKITITVSVR